MNSLSSNVVGLELKCMLGHKHSGMEGFMICHGWMVQQVSKVVMQRSHYIGGQWEVFSCVRESKRVGNVVGRKDGCQLQLCFMKEFPKPVADVMVRIHMMYIA